ncbi:MAG: Ppx/GppA family phosphatase [Alphaproteobacteria bacterium]|nr:Ppx/GppA family phosphatase [Alphaproteobacteria bacterium]
MITADTQAFERTDSIDGKEFRYGQKAIDGNGHYAVIDVGSNSVRLVVYDRLGRAPLPRFNEKSLCGLGDGLAERGELAEDAIDQTLHALHRYTAVAAAMGVGRIDIIATEAVRRASNGAVLVEAIKEHTGLETHVLSGEEEARFAALGVISGFHRPKGLVGDLGGGSLDLAEVIDDQVGDRRISLPIGALPITLAMTEDASAAKRSIDELLVAELPPLLAFPTFYAIGGGWRALARVHMAMNDAPVKIAHGYSMDAADARVFAKSIRRLDPAAVADLPNVPTRRVRTLRAAALVMERVLRRLKPETVIFSALGLREGWLYEQLPKADRALDPLIEGAHAFAAPRSRIPAFAAALVRWTDGLFPVESEDERRIRIAATALSDIAWSDHANVQAKQSFERVLQFPFVGLDHVERVYLAAVIHARYDGKADDPILQPAIDLLSPHQGHRAQILGRAMQLGHRFSGSVPEILDTARIAIAQDHVSLLVSDTESVPDSDAVRSRLRGLAKAIGVRRSEIVKVDNFSDD